MADSQEIQELEKWVLNPNKRETFLKSLIRDTESHYYYSLLDSIHKFDVALTSEQQQLFESYKKFHSEKSQSLELRLLFKQYDAAKTDAQRLSYIKLINKKMFSVGFNVIQESNIQEGNNYIHERRLSCSSLEFSPQLQQQSQSGFLKASEDSDSDNVKSKVTEVSSKFNNEKTQKAFHFNKVYENLDNIYELQQQVIADLDMTKVCQQVKNGLKKPQTNKNQQINKYIANLEIILQHERIFEYSNETLSLLIETYEELKITQNKKYQFNLSIFDKMTLEQLQYLQDNYDHLKKNQQFVKEFYTKKFKSGEKLDSQDPEYSLKYLQNLKDQYQWAAKLPIVFRSLSDQLLYQILQYGIHTNHYDFDLFLTYIKNPKDEISNYSNTKYINAQKVQRKQYNYDSYWHNVHNIKVQDWNSQGTLINTYILKYYQINKSTSIAPLDDYFEQRLLNRQLILAQLLNGVEDVKQVSEYFSKYEIQEMQSKKTLKLSSINKGQFKHGEEVKLVLEMQNITNLKVKIYEIQTENYYLNSKTEFDLNLDLDGMQSNEEQTFDFTDSNTHPCKQFKKEFKFDSITKLKRGIFVIEFVANGLGSRAVIKKGNLNFIERFTIAGQSIKIIDDQGEIQRQTEGGENVGLWLNKKFYNVDQDGEIIIPYHKSSSQTEKIILVSEGFAQFRDFSRLNEKFNFQCNFIYNEESFIMGKRASILVQPRLNLYKEIAPINLISKIEIIIVTKTEDGTPNTTKYDLKQFDSDKDYEAVFQIPAKLQSISIEVKGKIQKSKDQDDKSFESIGDSTSIAFDNQINRLDYTSLTLTQNTKQEYELRLLGKNGEPLPKVDISLTYHLNFLQNMQSAKVITNKDGIVNLGALQNVSGVKALVQQKDDIESTQQQWWLEKQQNLNVPSKIRIIEGESLNLPYINVKNLDLNKQNFALVRQGTTGPVQDLFNLLKIENDNITVTGLQVGTYKLQIYPLDISIQVKVIKDSKRWGLNQILQQSQDTKLYDTPELAQLSRESVIIKDISVEEKEEQQTLNIDLNINEQLVRDLRTHVILYQKNTNDVYLVGKLNNYRQKQQFSEKAVSLTSEKNRYLSNREIASEISYVIDRKSAVRFTGNSLEKPQILIKRANGQTTRIEDEVLKKGGKFSQNNDEDLFEDACDSSYDEDSEEEYCKKPVVKKKSKVCGASKHKGKISGKLATISSKVDFAREYIINYPINQNINFLQNPASVHSNLKVENGRVSVQIPKENIYIGAQIIVSTAYGTEVSVKPIKPSFDFYQSRDLRQKTNLKQGKFYSIFRDSKDIKTGNEFTIKDFTTTEYSAIDSLEKLYDLINELSKFNKTNSDGFDEWKFLKSWHKLEEKEKLQKYNEFYSNELNIYLYFKDKEFLKTVVVPLLDNKIEKNLIDWFLLEKYDKALEIYDNVEHFEYLNGFEKCLILYILIIKGRKEDAHNYLNYFENLLKLKTTDIERYKKLFDISLNQVGEDIKQLKKEVANAEKIKIQQVSGNRQQQHHYTQQIQQQQQQQNSNMIIQQAPQIQQMIQQVPQQRMMQQQMIQQSPMMIPNTCPLPPQAYSNVNYSNNNNNNNNSNNFFNTQMSGGGRQIQHNNTQYNAHDSKYQQQRYTNIQNYKNLENTKRYEETHYYKKDNSIHTTFSLINPNSFFWLDFARHIYETGQLTNFLSKNIIYTANNLTEKIFALSISGLPNNAPKHDQTTQDKSMIIKPVSDFLAFTKEIKEAGSKFRQDILINQRFFDPKDRYSYDEDDPSNKFEKDVEQFTINKIYGCQVIVTNLTASTQQLQVLHEVPEGSLPVKLIQYTKSQLFTFQKYQSQVLEYFFYFPQEGEFSIYPANAAKDGQVYATGKEYTFIVKKEKDLSKSSNINEILSTGNKDEILKYIKEKNIYNNNVFSISSIYKFLDDREFYVQLTDILKQRRYYNSHIFSYAIYHSHHETLRDYFNHYSNRQTIQNHFKYIDSSLIKIDHSLESGQSPMKLYEFYPLLNSRVHSLEQGLANILNSDFKRQYQNFLQYLAEKNKLNLADKTTLVYYLLLQERINEAIEIYSSISPMGQGVCQLQYDYIGAYLDFYNGYPNFTKAREIIEKYLDYPVIGWRNLFYEMANQLGEYDGEELEADQLLQDYKDNQKTKKQNETNAEKQPLLSVKIQNEEIIIEHKNIADKNFSINFYIMDLEIFFSKKPFLSQLYEDFSYLKPSEQVQVTVNNENPEGSNTTKTKVIESLRNVNVFVQVSSTQKKSGGIYFSTSLNAEIFDEYGQLKVTDKNQKPLSKVYVKTFSKSSSDQVKFHKDGYTDLRGKFDYLSLNSKEKSDIKKISLFICSDDYGSLIKEADVPQDFGKQNDTVQLRSHKYRNILENRQKK